jgi:hypothetical protein
MNNNPQTMNTNTTHTFIVALTQEGNGTELARFYKLGEAIDYMQNAWNDNHSHPDFTRGGESRARWTIERVKQWDEECNVADTDEVLFLEADSR